MEPVRQAPARGFAVYLEYVAGGDVETHVERTDVYDNNAHLLLEVEGARIVSANRGPPARLREPLRGTEYGRQLPDPLWRGVKTTTSTSANQRHGEEKRGGSLEAETPNAWPSRERGPER